LFYFSKNREREKKENRLTRAEGELSTAELNKLRGQAVTVTFEDVTSCIDVSVLIEILINILAFL